MIGNVVLSKENLSKTYRAHEDDWVLSVPLLRESDEVVQLRQSFADELGERSRSELSIAKNTVIA